jgi:enamine deaminase RidA (YjgF/YER057c/UK114 family)
MTHAKQAIEPCKPDGEVSRAPDLPLSPVIRASDFVRLSGMAAIDPATGEPAQGTVAAETRQILRNRGELLEASGSSLAKVVKVSGMMYPPDHSAVSPSDLSEPVPACGQRPLSWCLTPPSCHAARPARGCLVGKRGAAPIPACGRGRSALRCRC